MIFHRKCSHCGTDYEYEGCANLIVFCPHCHKHDFLECEYGYGPVIPCTVYLGSEKIGEITQHDSKHIYRYDSDRYNIHIVLKASYLDALYEARDLMAKTLEN